MLNPKKQNVMEPVFYNHEDSYKAVRLNGILAMFTISRIERDSLPEGIYAYDVRESDDGNQLSTIEPSVCVNHGGTILTFQEIPTSARTKVYLLKSSGKNFRNRAWASCHKEPACSKS